MTRRTLIVAILSSPIVVLGTTFIAFGAGEASVPFTFSSGTPAFASQVNSNFASLRDQITANVAVRGRLTYSNKAVDSTLTPTVWEQLRSVAIVTKARSDTDLILRLDTNLWVNNTVDAQLQIRVDGVSDGAAGVGPIVRPPSGITPYSAPVTLYGVFEGLGAGTHTVSIWVRTLNGAGTVSENDAEVDCTLYVEETPSR